MDAVESWTKFARFKFFKVSMQEMTISCDGDTWTIFTSTTLKNMTKTFKVAPQQNWYLCEWVFDKVVKMTCFDHTCLRHTLLRDFLLETCSSVNCNLIPQAGSRVWREDRGYARCEDSCCLRGGKAGHRGEGNNISHHHWSCACTLHCCMVLIWLL